MDKIQILKSNIEELVNISSYQVLSISGKHKTLALSAFQNLLNKDPQGMSSYLLSNSRNNFQSKLFQEFISLWEQNLPFYYIKDKDLFLINSLLNPKLSLFDGISTFENTVFNSEIKNNTQEIYFGNRKDDYVQPYFIGKLLSVYCNNNPITDKVQEYSFNKIFINVENNTKVTVKHLRIPPHYQMGGMSYINQARKKILETL